MPTNDFDPIFGEWRIHNRRLKARFAACTEWDEFTSTSKARPILGGIGNIDEIQFSTKGYTGGTLRLFNSKTGEWSIHWMTDRTGTLDPPVIGRFDNAGRGEFYGDDVDDGKPVRVRFIWSDMTGESAHWEQAFSLDQGHSWETNWTMDLTRIRSYGCCPVIELRQYAMHPGRRDDLIALFDEHFVEGQEKYGMRIIGQFRDRNNPDRFVWIRGLPSMDARRQALEGFYGGPVWAAHRTAANDTMTDSSNVLLLKPARAGSGFDLDALPNRPPVGNSAPPPCGNIIAATICYLNKPASEVFVDRLAAQIASSAEAAGVKILGYFVTESSTNTFPRLPVREGEHVLVWFGSFPDGKALESFRSTGLRQEVLELIPTSRSLLR
ncbi:MAG TPA: NIPSNAP family protein [Bryobacteraceae bacterium]|jgi:hypothetical protein